MNNLENILFIDIETVPLFENFEKLSEKEQKLWSIKAKNITAYSKSEKISDESIENNLYERAGIYAEFGKIICISAGYFRDENFRITSFSGDDEFKLLNNFSTMLDKYFQNQKYCLCAHNGKEFDFPFLSRRMVINKIKIPDILDISGKKPWEINNIDTMEMWKFGDYKNYTSLDLLAYILKIPTPKDDIDGSQVAEVYYKEKNLDRIVSYCNKDVLTVARVYCYFKNLPYIDDNQVVLV